MKNLFLFSLIALSSGFSVFAQDKKEVKKAVESFSKAADTQDAEALNTILDDKFRAVVNRAFGSEEISIMDKSLYLQLIKDKKIGGDSRKVEIISIDITGNNANVKAVLNGKVLIFTTYISLVKNKDGKWLVVGDMPHIEKAGA